MADGTAPSHLKIISVIFLQFFVKFYRPVVNLRPTPCATIDDRSQVLIDAGLNVADAVDGLDALEKYQASLTEEEGPFDVIFIDFVMPHMDGPTATAELRRLGFMKKIIAVTGNVLQVRE